jgi:2-oxoglutarate ferredoxin oxidoreductase subunit gamma
MAEQVDAGAVPAAPDSRPAARVEIRCSGSGGQGILLAAAIIAEAAAALGRHVVQTQSYGPEARGGASKAEVIIADEPIDYPEVDRPEVSLVLSQAAYAKYAKDTRPGGLLVYDSGLVEVDPDDLSVVRCGLPFTQVAADELGKKVVTNIVAVGALAALGDALPADAVREAVLSRVPPRFKELNERAFDLGLRLGEEARAMLATGSAGDAAAGEAAAGEAAAESRPTA